MMLNQLSHTGQGKPCPFYFSVIVACSFWSHDTYQTHGKAVLYIRIHTCFPWTNDPTMCQALCQTMNLQEPRLPRPSALLPTFLAPGLWFLHPLETDQRLWPQRRGSESHPTPVTAAPAGRCRPTQHALPEQHPGSGQPSTNPQGSSFHSPLCLEPVVTPLLAKAIFPRTVKAQCTPSVTFSYQGASSSRLVGDPHVWAGRQLRGLAAPAHTTLRSLRCFGCT